MFAAADASIACNAVHKICDGPERLVTEQSLEARTKTPGGRRTANLEAVLCDGHFACLALCA